MSSEFKVKDEKPLIQLRIMSSELRVKDEKPRGFSKK